MKIVELKSRKSKRKSVKIGEGLPIKINANIGTSPVGIDLKKELKKVDIAIKYGADTIMDLSTGGNIRRIRKEILSYSKVPVGTVPIYEVFCRASRKGLSIKNIDEKFFLEVLYEHFEDGVDFVTIHSAVTGKAIEILKKTKRVGGVVSRGGSLTLRWMIETGKENPYYKYFDEIMRYAKENSVTLSIGDGLRPGAIDDSLDELQTSEIEIQGELIKIAMKNNVKAIVEGPGHVPLNEVEKQIKFIKEKTYGAPLYVLGPIVTDVAPGYDHITSAIGGALAGYFGADFLCYVTPSEHLSLPDIEDVKLGVIACKIAAHSANVARGIKDEFDDRIFSKARRKLNWKMMQKLAIDPEKIKKRKKGVECSMCGKYCALKQV
ncbi:MAG: phosphomethylpyrimidine synthase [Caldiserica bacterium]|nr:MAG: phosphomethylpyrimidine synthase [Caldisericota bacterium]